MVVSMTATAAAAQTVGLSRIAQPIRGSDALVAATVAIDVKLASLSSAMVPVRRSRLVVT